MHFDSNLSNPDQVKGFSVLSLNFLIEILVAENLEISKEPNYIGELGDLATS